MPYNYNEHHNSLRSIHTVHHWLQEYNIFYNIFDDKIYNISIFIIDKRLLLD